VHNAVDEQCRCAQYLARGQAALDIAADPLCHSDTGTVAVERRHVEAEFGGVPEQVGVFERLLPVEQQLVHVPEAALHCGWLCRGRGSEGVRVDAGLRKMPEREPHAPAELLLDMLDRVERLP